VFDEACADLGFRGGLAAMLWRAYRVGLAEGLRMGPEAAWRQNAKLLALGR
jgi:hypothetical protein